MRNRAVMIVIICALALIIGACLPLVLTVEPRPEPPVVFDVEPTEIFSPAPRTPRPRPTATGTIAPTPTIPAGLYLFDTDDPGWTGSCLEAVQTAIPTVPMATRVTVEDGVDSYGVAVCNMTGQAVSLQLRQEAFAEGYSIAYTMSRGCYPTWPHCVNFPMYQALTWDSGPIYNCTFFGAPICPERTGYHIGTWFAGPVTPSPSQLNVYTFGSIFGAELGCCGSVDPVAWGEYELEYTWDGNPPADSGPTPTAVAAATPWITEVQARVQGAVCGNWNLRGRCDVGDQFAEVGVGSPVSLSGYYIDVTDAGGNVQCTYTIRADNLMDPLKVYWNDSFHEPPPGGGTPTPRCGLWPETGHIKLYSPQAVLLDDRPYDYSNGGQYGDSWAATDWTNPDGYWWWYVSSPGRGNRIPPTAVPTPTGTP